MSQTVNPHSFKIDISRLERLIFFLLPGRSLKRRLYYRFHPSILSPQPGRVAVHLHLYHPELASEFKAYLAYIPFLFDLYISISDASHYRAVYTEFSRLLNAETITIRQVENSGRHYKPLLTDFSEELASYDYLLHIHTKRGIPVDSSHDDWRKYLLNNLIGSSSLIMRYLDYLKNQHVGLAYPEIPPVVPYLTLTWQQSIGPAFRYFSKLNLPIRDEYLNFPAGGMFWCRPSILQPLFNLQLSTVDFGPETGQPDGTLAHACERALGLLNSQRGLDFAIYNPTSDTFNLNFSSLNLDSYLELNLNGVFNFLSRFNIITFDIFDTLVTRTVYEPDDIFRLIDQKVQQAYGFYPGEFIKLRKKAEANLRELRSHQGDVNIHQIYEEFARLADISLALASEIKDLEITTDLATIIPRQDVHTLYQRLLKEGKELIIISDMYYTQDIIERILKQCGYEHYFELLISSEVGFRKSNGTMWHYFFKKYPDIDSIHVDDNETISHELLAYHQKMRFYLMSGKKSYELSRASLPPSDNLNQRLVQGLIINKQLANSPFALTSDRRLQINNLYSYGYAVIAPVMVHFFKWLTDHTEPDTALLFVSREGFYLQKIYQDLLHYSQKKPRRPHLYLLSSRRAASVANLRTEDDLRTILKTSYQGSLQGLLQYRLGFKLPSDVPDLQIELPSDLKHVVKILQPYLPEIFSNAQVERQNYLAYLHSLPELNSSRLCLVDLGYSGTIQFHLSRLLGHKISGAYFITSDHLKPLIDDNIVQSCFNSTVYNHDFLKHPIGRYNLFLEAFLTSNQGQLINFNPDGTPNFQEQTLDVSSLDQIYHGVHDFICDLSALANQDIFDLRLDKDFIEQNFARLLTGSRLSDDIKKTLQIEDFYTKNHTITLPTSEQQLAAD